MYERHHFTTLFAHTERSPITEHSSVPKAQALVRLTERCGYVSPRIPFVVGLMNDRMTAALLVSSKWHYTYVATEADPERKTHFV
jgi:hypothetical protein